MTAQKASPGNGKRPPRGGGSRAASLDDDLGLFVDDVPRDSQSVARPPPEARNKKGGRAADRRRDRGQAPEPEQPRDTATAMKQNGRGASLERGTLHCTAGPEAGTALPLLEGEHYTVGRARENSFVLKDIAASRRHLRLEVDAAGVRVVDLGSGNGTRVNGRRIQQHDMQHGDRIEIGGSVLVLIEPGRDLSDVAQPDNQERVLAAADKLAAELERDRVRFGDDARGGDDDGHQAQTRQVNGVERERALAAARAEQAAKAQQRPATRAAERRWNETFTNMPLSAVVPADEPLRGGRPDAVTAPPPAPAQPRRTNTAMRRPPPMPPPREEYDEPLPPEPVAYPEPSTSSGGGGFLFSLLITAGIVVVLGGGLLLAFVMVTRESNAKADAVGAVDAARQSEFDAVLERCRQASAAGQSALAYELATLALQLRPGDRIATAYQIEAKKRLEAPVVAPTPQPATTSPAAAPVAAAPAAAAAPVAPAPATTAPPPAAEVAPAAAAQPEVRDEPRKTVVKKAPARVEKPRAAPARSEPREAARSEPQRSEPKKRTGRGMSEDDAQALFEDAISALRDKDTKGGCRLLERVADKAPPASRWKEKAESLFSRRCSDG